LAWRDSRDKCPLRHYTNHRYSDLLKRRKCNHRCAIGAAMIAHRADGE
jgi:hypothetical protein